MDQIHPLEWEEVQEEVEEWIYKVLKQWEEEEVNDDIILSCVIYIQIISNTILIRFKYFNK